MSKYRLRVVFDKHGRFYHFNEQISGRVILETDGDLTYRKIWIDYYWKTHGQGNTDKAKKITLLVASEGGQLKGGQYREFPFRFNAPNGPVTYHGYSLNIDWYLCARVDIPFGPNKEVEQDFLLLASESPEEIIIGNSTIPKDKLPIHSQITQGNILDYPQIQKITQKKTFFSRIENCIMVFLLFLSIITVANYFFKDYPWYIWAVIFVVVLAVFFGFRLIRKTLLKTRFEIIEQRILPSVLYTGNPVSCQLQLRMKHAGYLEHISANISAKENCISGAGTRVIHFSHIAYNNSFEKPFSEDLAEGRIINFYCLLPTPPNSPATFATDNNSIEWEVKLKISMRRWPAWEKTFPLIVLPSHESLATAL